MQKVIKSVLRYAASAALVFVIVFVYHTIVKVNPTTVALTFLLGVLILSATWGLRPAVFTAIVAAAAFNYYFLPPVGTVAIADPQNWVALFAFLVTAVIASDLSERARREARNANERRRDVERLYVRTPLTAIKASVTSLLGSPNLDPAPRHELLTVINEESDRLNRLVGEAAEMAQLDANQVELRLEPHNIEEVIEEAVRESKQLLSARPVEVRLVPDLPPVGIDSGRIKEVLM